MKLTVKSYDAEHDYHICVDKSGTEHRVDLFVGSPEMANENNDSLIGEEVEVESLQPYISLAVYARVINQESTP